MDFGNLPQPEQINFLMPPAPLATGATLARISPVTYLKPQVYLGCPTWVNKAWLGSYYPASLTGKDYLHAYSRQFNTIELNTTHYRIPDADTVAKWCEAVTPGFKFCPKWPRQVSHEQELQGVAGATQAFCTALLQFKDHLGMSFLQLSPAFGPDRLHVLEHFLSRLPRQLPLALELRHAGWFTDVAAFEELSALLEACEVSTVITDVAGRRDVLHQRLTTTTAFIRFNGYLHDATDYIRADAWVNQLAAWFEQGLQMLYFIVHYEDIRHSPLLIRYILKKLAATCNMEVDLPKPVPQPIQGSLF